MVKTLTNYTHTNAQSHTQTHTITHVHTHTDTHSPTRTHTHRCTDRSGRWAPCCQRGPAVGGQCGMTCWGGRALRMEIDRSWSQDSPSATEGSSVRATQDTSKFRVSVAETPVCQRSITQTVRWPLTTTLTWSAPGDQTVNKTQGCWMLQQNSVSQFGTSDSGPATDCWAQTHLADRQLLSNDNKQLTPLCWPLNFNWAEEVVWQEPCVPSLTDCTQFIHPPWLSHSLQLPHFISLTGFQRKPCTMPPRLW